MRVLVWQGGLVGPPRVLLGFAVIPSDICRELYDHAMSTTILPDDPVFSMRTRSGRRQVLTYVVMRQAVKAAAIRLGVDPTKFSLHSLRIGVFIHVLTSTIRQWTTNGSLVCYP
jgi:hypothetical protein